MCLDLPGMLLMNVRGRKKKEPLMIDFDCVSWSFTEKKSSHL